MPDATLRLPFRYALGQEVSYEGTVWRIVGRRWEEGGVGVFLTYLLADLDGTVARGLGWVTEYALERGKGWRYA